MYFRTHPDIQYDCIMYHLEDLRREGARMRKLQAFLDRRKADKAPKAAVTASPNHAAAATTS
jgi:hypothetical protein